MSRPPRNFTQETFAAGLSRDDAWAYQQLIIYLQDENTQLKQLISSADKSVQVAHASNAHLQIQVQRQGQFITHYEEMNKILAQGLDKVIDASQDASQELQPKVAIEEIVDDLIQKQLNITSLETTNRKQEAQIKNQRQCIKQLEQYQKQGLI